ncbi:Zn(2+)-responsive transcriptional regulator [Corallincola holothuriorum]|uniref:Zn(2+)-responsive transcriptional regulator n=1 Tax=Corallincola holothuriorum TaxID=2282215 RepID=A0A368NHK8_9GAMM|nr:Zn(2+)-responsive transcriptional regulator [Corallincola holothuriorum]RCU49610.1 Zn(2+)-responsive transcriptional regulator [Corallincola holothuriorum]
MYKIGELSRLTGVSNDTLRYYEKMELILPADRTAAGYRLYEPAALERLRFIQRAKMVGFTLDGIKELLSLRLDKAHHSCGEVKQMTENKLQEIEQKLTELKRIRGALRVMNDACCGGDESAEHCTILQALETGEPVKMEAPC